MLSLIKSWHHPNKKYICLKANCFFDLIKCWWHKFSKFCESNSRWAYNLWRPPCGDIIKIRKLIYIQILISSVYLLNCWWNGFQMITWSGWCFLREDVIRIKKKSCFFKCWFLLVTWTAVVRWIPRFLWKQPSLSQ